VNSHSFFFVRRCFFSVLCKYILNKRIYLFSISAISPSSTGTNLQQTVAISRQNNDVLSTTNDKSSLLQTADNKIKMNENQTD
jgi:hypothetical protein